MTSIISQIFAHEQIIIGGARTFELKIVLTVPNLIGRERDKATSLSNFKPNFTNTRKNNNHCELSINKLMFCL